MMNDRGKIRLIFVVQLVMTSFSYAQEITYDSQNARKAAAAIYYEKGNSIGQRQRYALAVAYYDSALRLFTGNADYYFARGQMKELLQDYVGALIDYEIVTRKEPDNHVALFKRALIYHRQGNFRQAVKDFTVLINAEANLETKAVVFKAATFDEKGLFASSSIASMNEMTSDFYLSRALSYQALGFVALTIADFNKAIELNNNAPDFYVNRGLFYRAQHDYESAELDFRHALKIDANHRLALYNLLFLVGEEEKGEINQLLYDQGDFGMAYSKSAFDNYQKGRYTQALIDYDSALLIKNDEANDLMNRGMVKIKLKNYSDAIKDFKASIEVDDGLNRNLVLIANTYQKLTQYSLAIEYYKKYLVSENEDSAVYYNLGLAYLNNDQEDEACLVLKQAILMGEDRAESPLRKVCFTK